MSNRQGRTKVPAYQPGPTPSSSPSPSPPPPSSTPPFQATREKRRSFNTQRAPTPSGRPVKALYGPSSSAPAGSDDSHGDATIEEDTEVERFKSNGSKFLQGSAVETLESPVVSDGQAERQMRRGRLPSTEQQDTPRRLSGSSSRPQSGYFQHLAPRAITPASRKSASRPSLPAVLPLDLRLGHRRWVLRLTRRRCERALLAGSVMFGAWRLAKDHGETLVATEMLGIALLSLIYLRFRSISSEPTELLAPLARRYSPPQGAPSNSSQSHHRLRDHRHGLTTSLGASRGKGEVEGNPMGGSGFIWATDERNYRDCIDDGALFALLFGPLLSGAMLYSTLERLENDPTSFLPSDWLIERPLVLDSTPSHVSLNASSNASRCREPSCLALSALALSRRHLAQMTCLLSATLLVHLLWSRRLEIKQAKEKARQAQEGLLSPTSTPGVDVLAAAQASGRPSWMWARISEWRRTWSIVTFSFLLTGCATVFKMAAERWRPDAMRELSYSDIVLATLFYQFSLYVCVRLARRGFTLGELGAVCQCATGLFMETVNLTRMKIAVFRTPFIKSYRLPTPLLIFQLALIPGCLLAGFLLSPLLVLSRQIAQKPAHRLRYPAEKEIYRKALAAGFYAGAAIICGGVVGIWTKWCLRWRDPWLWAVFYIVEGRRWWSRPLLLAYWGLLAVISLAGWSRQLTRSRKNRSWVTTTSGTTGSRVSVKTDSSATGGPTVTAHSPTARASPSPAETGGFSSVATQMMDAADQRMPTLSVNARRKFFHGLAVVMFVPGIVLDPAFTHLAFSFAFAVFTFCEYIRYFALYPLGATVHLFLNEFLDESKDSGTAVLSHFYLLTGCATALWLESPKPILSLFGVLALGVGDALASIVGRRYGRIRWSTSSQKTIEGSLAFWASVVASGGIIVLVCGWDDVSFLKFILMTLLATLLEALSEQNDNLILPIWGWCVGVLMGV